MNPKPQDVDPDPDPVGNLPLMEPDRNLTLKRIRIDLCAAGSRHLVRKNRNRIRIPRGNTTPKGTAQQFIFNRWMFCLKSEGSSCSLASFMVSRDK